MWTENTCVQQYYLYDIVKYKEKTADKLSISSQVTDEHKPSVCAIVESIMIEVDTLNGLLVMLKQNKTKTKSNKQTRKGQVGLCIKASLVYRASSRTDRVTQRNPALEK